MFSVLFANPSNLTATVLLDAKNRIGSIFSAGLLWLVICKLAWTVDLTSVPCLIIINFPSRSKNCLKLNTIIIRSQFSKGFT